MPDAIQLREYSRSSAKEGILYITDSNDDLNVFNVNHNDDDLWLNTNNGKPDNFWNGNNRWVFRRRNLFHFLPCFGRGVLFCKLAIPAPEHFTDSFYF